MKEMVKATSLSQSAERGMCALQSALPLIKKTTRFEEKGDCQLILIDISF
jgi:hypothetical protein